MVNSDSCEPDAQAGVQHLYQTVRADLRALCDRMFLDLTELMARVDGLPITDNWRVDDPTPDERLAAAWHWWMDQQERRRR
jgi:hypothetical protein